MQLSQNLYKVCVYLSRNLRTCTYVCLFKQSFESFLEPDYQKKRFGRKKTLSLHFIHVVFRGALKRVLRRDSGGNWQVEEDQKEINTDVLHWLQCFTLLLFAESNKPFMNECRVGLSLASITQSIKTD